MTLVSTIVAIGAVFAVAVFFYIVDRRRERSQHPSPPVDQPAETASARRDAPLRSYEPNREGRFFGLCAMVVDDSDTVQRMLAMLLAPEGLGLRFAKDRRAARLERVGWDADLLIVDRDLWQAGDGPDLGGAPVVLLAGEGAGPSGDEGPSVAAVVPKPFESGELIDAVGRALEGSADRVVCPVCGCAAGAEPVPCQSCGAAHHAECWTLNDGCGRCGQED